MNPIRNGNFSSSGIVPLTTYDRSGKKPGVPFFSYIEEKNMERRLCRSVKDDVDARAVSWGHLLEGRSFNLLGTEYKLCSQETIQHPEIDYWCGSPDAEKFDAEKTVIDFKCPYTLKSFCQMVDGFAMDGIAGVREKHKDGNKYYWQIVSNAILTGAKFGELIVYAPYQSELEAIRELARNFDGEKQHRYRWIDLASDDELPFLLDGGYYKNINVMRFEIPSIDKQFLEERVIEGGKLLVERTELVTV